MNAERAKLESNAAAVAGATSEHRAAAPDSAQQYAATAAFAPGDTIETRVPAVSEARKFGRYDLQRLIGQGGMGAVHLAQDGLLKRTVALKIPKFADDAPIHRDRFLREARSAALLTHPNICPVYDVGEVDGRPFLTMAYVDGPSLALQLHQSGPFDPHDAARLVGKLATAMQHAHEQGILHRDLKPGNILMNSQGEPIVMDFGLAFRFDAETSDRLTEQGLVVGTPAYMPPEQVNGQTLGPASDVYSLGVVLYELLTGKVPFEGPLGKLLAQIESAAPPPPSSLRPEIDPALEAICLRALAKRPADRFADMAAFAQALDDYVRGKATLTHFAAPTMMFRPPPRRRWALAAAMTGLLAAAATITAVVLWARRGEPEVAPVPEMQLTDADRLFEALVKPLVKLDVAVTDDTPLRMGRKYFPAELFLVPAQGGGQHVHLGPLYFSVTGTGSGHELDLSDQPGQAGQVTHFGGEITVTAPYLLFLGNLTPSSRIYIKGGIGYSILAPMQGGVGSKHVEFDGTHFLMPKLGEPTIDTSQATAAERASLRNKELIDKVVWSYPTTEYVIYCRPGTQVVPGNHELRKVQFPQVYDIIEADRKRQDYAPRIDKNRVQQALRAAGLQS